MNLQEWIDKGKPLKSFINCDCMDFMKKVPDKFFELAIVDPPYGIGDFWNKCRQTYHYGKKKWNEKSPDKEYFDELFRISQDQIIWGANYYTQYLENRNSWIVWDKERNADKTFMSECELAWTSYNKVMRIIKLKWDGARKCEKTYNQFHPNQRPIQLYRWILQKYAKPGDKIFDSHVGSASSLIACHLEGFKYIGCELDPDYYKEAKQRLDAYTAQGSLF